MTHEPVRVGVVDDHVVVARGLAADLTPAETGIAVVAVARTVPELVDRLADAAVDVVLLDLQLDDGSRPAVNVEVLRAAGAEVVLFSAYEEAQLVMEAVRAGAAGYVNKHREIADVAQAVREVAAGGEAVSPEMLRALASAVRERPQLSGQQESVLIRYTSTDAKLPTVARHLGMQPETLKTHLRRIKVKYAELGRPAHTRLDLYKRAVEDGYVPPAAG
ncbi:response regulator [Klenkia sp. LSe6-5]|uniref:Response regulator n=1 Tax=Klenkia sesuvii TaxID=3103137 RepID=A0ABU8DW33_9ACTN